MQDLANIRNQLSAQGLFDAFKLQLAKDFEKSNFPTEFVNALEPKYDTIHDRIVHELQHSDRKAESNLMNLINRIDISEPQLKKYLSKSVNENRFNVIAELIIKRVLQKVVIRQHYKNNDSSPELSDD